jgi:hypothetical protein
MSDPGFPWSLVALSAAVFAGLITNALWARVTTTIPTFANDHSERLNGIWLAKVRYANVPGRRGYELLRISQQAGKFTIYKEHYNSHLRLPVRLRGEGVFRGGMGSAYFYLNQTSAHQSGTMTFQKKGTDFGPPVLKGVYTQIIDREGELEGPLMEPYNLIRVQISLWQQFKRVIGRTYFENFGDIDTYVDRLPKEMTKYL